MSTPTHTLSDIMNAILTAIQETLYQVANAIAENASVIGSVLVIGGIAYAVMRYGSRIFRGLGRWFGGLF